MPKATEPITVSTLIRKPREMVWDFLTLPEHITQWCHASDDWHAPHAENDIREGGRFSTTMAARDGSTRFDFTGTYTEVVPFERYRYVMDGEDARTVVVTLTETNEGILVTEVFDPENENPIEMQRAGWQSILDNYKAYTESYRV
jgi:uncharacterized protein YndB with AHSA1/START domain